ncbi:MAG: TadE/TadG family type IV pilus assembly protein [Bryobacteraceae bacterium]
MPKPIRRRTNRRGSAILEFTMTGIPLMFVWISIMQMAIGMWQYHTLQYAVKVTGAYIAVHGSDCSLPGNTCSIEIENAAQVLSNYLIGLPNSQVSVTFNALASDHATVASTVSCTLSNCLTNTTAWPPASYNTPGTDIQVQALYKFNSALSMFVPSPGGGVVQFSSAWLPGFTQQTILF